MAGEGDDVGHGEGKGLKRGEQEWGLGARPVTPDLCSARFMLHYNPEVG